MERLEGHHVGGIHAGGALAGTAWLCAFTGVATLARAHHPTSVTVTTLVLSYGLVALALLVVVCAAPPVRSRAHDVFELSHRFGGWTAIGLFWMLTVHLAVRQRGDAAALEAIASSWHVWVLAILTASVASPWLRLRRVPVDRRAPVLARRHRPLRLRRHAGVRVGGRDQPQPVARMARVRDGDHARVDPDTACSSRVPATGPGGSSTIRRRTSGCGGRRSRRRWPRSRCSTSVSSTWSPAAASDRASGRSSPLASPRAWCGPRATPRPPTATTSWTRSQAAQPDAVIWDTTRRGKPDLAQLAQQACRDFDAEAVFVVSNKATTLRLVHGLERLGIPAFGPIWDS